jgi:5-methylcytosine-specific restriction endonuclease McrA
MRRKLLEVACEYCGKQFLRYPSEVYNHVFCSHSCYIMFYKTHKELREEMKRKVSKAKVVFYQKHPEYRKLASQQCKINCPTKREDVKRKIREKLLGRFVGKNNPSWRGGRSLIPYTPGFTETLKHKIIAMYGRCVLCGTSNDLVVHHIDFSKSNHNEDNLILLCRACHRKVHHYNLLLTNRQ